MFKGISGLKYLFWKVVILLYCVTDLLNFVNKFYKQIL